MCLSVPLSKTSNVPLATEEFLRKIEFRETATVAVFFRIFATVGWLRSVANERNEATLERNIQQLMIKSM